MTEEEQKEKLNDLKNRISFALKDATLQQGFEIICKRIAELEKENEELKAQIDKMKNCYNCKHNNEQDAEFCCNCDRPYEGEVIKDEWEG